MMHAAALPRSLRWFVIAAVGALAIAGCDDEGLDVTRTGSIEITPPQYTFPKISPGSRGDREVFIENTGSGPVLIRKIRLDLGDRDFQLFWKTSAEGEEYQGLTRGGEDRFDYPVRIDPDERLYLVLEYAPEDTSFEQGRVLLDTNLPEGEVAIPVVASEAGAEINVAPRTVDFDRVPARQEATRDVVVTNVGQATLNVTQILLNGSQDFTPLVNGKDPRRGQREVLLDADGDGVAGLAPSQQFTITVRYAPQLEGPDTGELSIFSDDPNQPEVKVDLRANGATPCLDVNPPALEFPTSLVNRIDSRPLSIESCGGQQLQIDDIRLSEDSDPAFALDEESLPETPALLPAYLPGDIPPSRSIRVSFTPREQRIHNGTLIIESSDPVTPSREVSLLGRGVLNACPQARALQDAFDVLPLDVVVLDGSPSIDQDGPGNRPVEYEWVITSRPEGSVSQPVEAFADAANPAMGGPDDEVETPVALFWVDLAGTYTAELRVKDNLGLDSVACDNAAVVTIIAKPDEAIHVQLVWDTPGDDDLTDAEGADLDLHLLHPSASNWFAAPYDCHFLNPVPDWGQPDNPADDPSLDIDDIAGGGPENINLDNPENTGVLGAPYAVGVHYYSSRGRISGQEFGPSFARVRIFLKGELSYDSTEDRGEDGPRELEAEDHFWDVARIHWPEMRVEARDQYFTQRPDAE
ncbi:MAG: choice-of-anchor D domain-containing protein [Myxococcales bacterium]|nr:choice-of-anchor D domain-containing protein [Myxococcales bacterium]